MWKDQRKYLCIEEIYTADLFKHVSYTCLAPLEQQLRVKPNSQIDLESHAFPFSHGSETNRQEQNALHSEILGCL